MSFVFSRLEYSKALSQEVRHQALAFGPVAKEVFGQGNFSKVQLFVRSPYFAAVCLAQWKHRGRLLQSSVHGDVVRCSDAQEAACYCKCFACDAGEPSWNLLCAAVESGEESTESHEMVRSGPLTMTSTICTKQTRN